MVPRGGQSVILDPHFRESSKKWLILLSPMPTRTNALKKQTQLQPRVRSWKVHGKCLHEDRTQDLWTLLAENAIPWQRACACPSVCPSIRASLRGSKPCSTTGGSAEEPTWSWEAPSCKMLKQQPPPRSEPSHLGPELQNESKRAESGSRVENQPPLLKPQRSLPASSF